MIAYYRIPQVDLKTGSRIACAGYVDIDRHDLCWRLELSTPRLRESIGIPSLSDNGAPIRRNIICSKQLPTHQIGTLILQDRLKPLDAICMVPNKRFFSHRCLAYANNFRTVAGNA